MFCDTLEEWKNPSCYKDVQRDGRNNAECMLNRIIQTDKAPAALGPYSQAVQCGDLIFTAGQLGIDPDTGALVSGGIRNETKQILNNISNILEAAGTGVHSLVKVSVFLTDLSDFAAFNEVYETFLDGIKPARTTVGVDALPAGACVEIEAVASRF